MSTQHAPHPTDTPDFEGAGTSAARVIAVVLLALVIAALLGASSLRRVAEREPYGWGRDVALAVTKPLDSVSHALFLDRPRQWIASATGHEDPATATVFAAPATTAPPTTEPLVTTVGPTIPAPETTAAPTTTIPPHRVPTPDAPLSVWMGGDSLMGSISHQVEALLPGDRVHVSSDIQVSTGLARPDVLDWAGELTNQMAATNPEVVIMSFGANDDQPLHTPDGGFARIYTPEWDVEYARRVGVMMDIASAGGTRTVLWLGLPAERPEQLNTMKDKMNAAAASEAAKRPDVTWIDMSGIVAGPDGGYTDDITRPDGSVIRARLSDGVHLTEEGAALVAPTIYNAFAFAWHVG